MVLTLKLGIVVTIGSFVEDLVVLGGLTLKDIEFSASAN